MFTRLLLYRIVSELLQLLLIIPKLDNKLSLNKNIIMERRRASGMGRWAMEKAFQLQKICRIKNISQMKKMNPEVHFS
jgi:hypothetical protein